ncbi:hypothetical protein LAC02_49800 [Ligilactobacillus acidipiscis]|nr:hypothetical protein LAC02_49800 [Ligilactobacillus acidipiscis]
MEQKANLCSIVKINSVSLIKFSFFCVFDYGALFLTENIFRVTGNTTAKEIVCVNFILIRHR